MGAVRSDRLPGIGLPIGQRPVAWLTAENSSSGRGPSARDKQFPHPASRPSECHREVVLGKSLKRRLVEHISGWLAMADVDRILQKVWYQSHQQCR
jgi:hypothetical protein